MPFDHRSLIHREAWLSPCFVRQNHQKKLFFCMAILNHFQTKMFKSETTSFHYFSRSSKNIGDPTSGNGGKKTFKRYFKSEHTDRRTDRRTNRLIESIGPEGRCFEKTCFPVCMHVLLHQTQFRYIVK